MSPLFVPASHFSIVQLSDIMTTCFQQYVVPLSVTPDYFAARFCSEGLNFTESVVWMQGEQSIAIALVTTRCQQARIAAFALHPDARGNGLAKPMMLALLSRLAEKNYVQVALEVIAENHAAVALYQALGFETRQTLLGFTGQESPNGPTSPLPIATTDALLRAIWHAPQKEIPWLLDPLSFPALPCQVVRDGEQAWAVIDWLTGAPQLRYLFVEPDFRHQGRARTILGKINAHYPGIRTPVSVPERFAPLFIQAGYQQVALQQYEMVNSLDK